MVGAISGSSFNPGTYLEQIKGIKPASSATAKPAESTSPGDKSKDVVSLLSSVSSASVQGGLIADIIGSASTFSSNPLAGVYNAFLYNKSTTSPLQQALLAAQQVEAASKTTSTNATQQALTSYHAGINAYNKILQQNAQAVLDEGQSLIT